MKEYSCGRVRALAALHDQVHVPVSGTMAKSKNIDIVKRKQ